MNRRTGSQAGLIAVIVTGILMPVGNAHAYLDPSTGSMVISAIVGIFASIALALKTYWYKIKNLFRRGDKRESASTDSID